MAFLTGFTPHPHDHAFFKVVFNNPDGTRTQKYVTPMNTVEIPDEPQQDGYTFLGWVNEFDFYVPITSDKTVSAVLRPNVSTVTFGCHHSEGCFPSPFLQETGSLPSALSWPQDATSPSRYVPGEPRYVFAGFHLGGARVYDANGHRIGDPQIVIPYDDAFLQLSPSWDFLHSDEQLYSAPLLVGIIGGVILLLTAVSFAIMVRYKIVSGRKVPKYLLAKLEEGSTS